MLKACEVMWYRFMNVGLRIAVGVWDRLLLMRSQVVCVVIMSSDGANLGTCLIGHPCSSWTHLWVLRKEVWPKKKGETFHLGEEQRAGLEATIRSGLRQGELPSMFRP